MGTRATLRQMSRFAKKGRADPEVINFARQIVARVPSKDWKAEVRAIQSWVKRNIRYTQDPQGVELVQDARRTIHLEHGDCDDHATLVATLLMAIGKPARFMAVAVPPNKQFCHVFAQVRIGGNWVTVETTEPVDIGWQPPQLSRPPMIEHIR